MELNAKRTKSMRIRKKGKKMRRLLLKRRIWKILGKKSMAV